MILACIVFLSALAYSRSLYRAEWIFDDPTITDGEWHYRNNAYGNAWSSFEAPRSMTGLVNTWIWRIGGFRVGFWKSVSLGFHALNIVLVHTGALLWVKDPQALVIAAVFALHPLQASAVCYVSARAGVQSATFAYAGLLCCSGGHWAIGALSFVLGAKSKEDIWIYLGLFVLLGGVGIIGVGRI